MFRTFPCSIRPVLFLALAAVTAGSAHAQAPDPRVGLKAGMNDAGIAIRGLRLVASAPRTGRFAEADNSDLAFTGHYAIQGNYNGFQVWDIADPAHPVLAASVVCPTEQGDVSVYKHLLFVSAESMSSRVDCGDQGVPEPESRDRMRGIRIYDIRDIRHPRAVATVQTCRGSHTHTLLPDPRDTTTVYVYVSGTSVVRSAGELAGCSDADLAQDPNTALFRLEVIRVPVAHPEQAAIVSSPRVFSGLVEPPRHHGTPADEAEAAAARARGEFVVNVLGSPFIVPPEFSGAMLADMVKARGGTGAPTAADSAALRAALPAIMAGFTGERPGAGPTQCHDITVYPEMGIAGGACAGYGLLLDIRDPAHPVRTAAVADSNFAFWHSATFSNDAGKVLFTDEWGGGAQPKCRSTDPAAWGADALFTRTGNALRFQGYYKLPAPQTPQENCVAHNGSLVPIPGRDVMVQSWYQGGVSVFDWTDPAHPKEIAFFDRGPVDAARLALAGSWSAYWYNGVIYSSEIMRGLDVLELVPGPDLTQHEIDAAKTVRVDFLNAQSQRRITWPPSFALSHAYLDQLERSRGMSAARIAATRTALTRAEAASGEARRLALFSLASMVGTYAPGSSDAAKVRLLAVSIRDLAER
ncbi:MAG: LVIVD repeat-containing protein [Longimicrobiaceae bacterium]